MLGRIRLTELQLLVVPSAMTFVGLLTIYLASTRDLAWNWRDIWVSLVFMGVVFSISIWFSLTKFAGDQVLFPITAALCGLGLLMIQRLGPDLVDRGTGYASLARNQFIYLMAGLALLLGMITFVKNINWLRRYKYTWAFGGIALMLLTMVLGTEEYGARLWLTVGPFSIQTSEIAKIALVVFLAAYLAENQELIAASYRVGPFRLPPIPYLMPVVLMWLFSMLVVVAQNDLGTALLFFGVFLSMLYLATGKLSYVIAGLGAFGVGVYAAYLLFDRVTIRVANWLNPWSDPLVAGYQQIQADYAMANGKVFGAGLAQGHPAFIPAVHSDYVFAAIGEELGLFGTLAVLVLFMLLVARGFHIAFHARDAFGRYLAAGLTTTLAIQTLLIVGGTVRLIPLTGITLPFISAGGSSLLTNFIIIGLLLRVSASSRTV